MSLLTRKRTVLAKIETTYGVDPTPTGSANAMLVKNLNINPIQAELVSRDLIRPYLGNSEQLLATTYVQMDFEVEMVGAGVVGKIPAYDPLLRACGFARTNVETNLTSLAVSSDVATATLAAHGYLVGDIVTITGSSVTSLNGEKTIATVPTSGTFTFDATGETDGPATGAKIISAIRYAPISEGFESVTMYYNVDGVLHKISGARGTVELSLSVRQIPVYRFNFTGLYSEPTDTAAPSVDFSAFKIPQIANTQNTPGFSLFGYSADLESMSLNVANDVQYITLIGSESVKILDRAPAGQLQFEAPTIADKNYWQEVAESTPGVMSFDHGSRHGWKVSVYAPSVLLGNPTYQDSNGVQFLSAPFTCNPLTGNDELRIDIK